MKVSLSKKGKEKVMSVEVLKSMKANQLNDDQAFEVEDGTVYAWDEAPRSVGMKKAFALDEGGEGRWIEQPRGHRIGEEVDKEEHLYFDPLLGKSEAVSAASGSQPFSVVEDFDNQIKNDMATDPPVRSAHTAIAELVTEPRDEFAEDFLDPMEAASDAAAKIEGKTEDLTKRVPASQVFEGAAEDIYLGVNLGEKEENFQTTAANVQATFGVQLPGVPELFEQLTTEKGRGQDEKLQLGGSVAAVSRTVKAATEIGVKIGPRLQGLLHLISLYLIAGMEQSGNILKNFSPLLIRNHVANNRIEGLGPEAEDLDEKSAGLIGTILIQQTGRVPEDSLLSRTPDSPRVGGWVQQALFGKIDQDPFLPLLGDMKKLGPEPVGPKGEAAGVVLEERRVIPPQQLGTSRFPRGEWVRLAKGYQERFQKLNTPGSSGEKEEGVSTKLDSQPSFGGELGSQSSKKSELPEFGAGLKEGTILLIGGIMKGRIEEVEDKLYKVTLVDKNTTIKLPFSRPNVKVIELPE